jgi:prepilin signal peptidase PulO-like enzyme (type II secretory pathway)
MREAFTCPHCGEQGISFISKLITSAATLGGWGAKCRYCGQQARISYQAARLQFILFVAAIATIPWLLEGQLQYIAGYAAAAAIVAVGMLAPLRKDLLNPP